MLMNYVLSISSQKQSGTGNLKGGGMDYDVLRIESARGLAIWMSALADYCDQRELALQFYFVGAELVACATTADGVEARIEYVAPCETTKPIFAEASIKRLDLSVVHARKRRMEDRLNGRMRAGRAA